MQNYLPVVALAILAAILLFKLFCGAPHRPQFFIFVTKGKKVDILTYQVVAVESSASDVVSRELRVSIDSAEPSTMVINGKATTFDAFDVKQGSAVRIELTDIDDSGNRSEPAIAEFVALDTLPPPVPGFSVSLIAERTEE